MTFKSKNRRFGSSLATMFLAVVVLFGATSPSLAAVRCDGLYFVPVYGQLKESFQHDQNYKVVIENQGDIKNQCSLGTCHLHSWISLLERNYKAVNKTELKISTHYLSARHWLEKSLQAIEKPEKNDKDDKEENKIKVALGADSFASRRAILSYGIIPDHAWTANRDFQSAPFADRIKSYITNIIARARMSKEQTTDEKQKQRIHEIAEQQIIDVFGNMVGHFPETFEFNGQQYTPKEFAKKFFPELQNPVVQMRVNNLVKTPRAVTEFHNTTTVKTSVEEVSLMARRLLDEGKNVYLAYEHSSEFVDRKTGVMSIDAFYVPPGGAPMSRQLRAHFETEGGGHAVQLVGYDFDPMTNKVVKWKILNSWGEKAGDQGYFHMYDDYFRTFLRGITFYGRMAKPEPTKPEPSTREQLKQVPFLNK